MPDEAPIEPAAPPRRGRLSKLLMPLVFVGGAVAGGAGAAIGMLKFLPEREAAHPPQPTVEPIAYVDFETPFTANLADTGRFLQVKLSVSTLGGQRVTDALAKHKPAITAALLAVLGDCTEADVENRRGREAVKRRLRDAVNAILKAQGEPVGIEDVLVTSMVIQ